MNEITSNAAPTRSHWSSRWAFFLVTIGSAVGLGNIWKFPYMTGKNGGSAFVLVYLACIFAIGVPLLIAELMLGRRGQGNPVATMGTLAREAGTNKLWKVLGLMGIIGALLIFSFYSVVAGWILDYSVQAINGFAGTTPEIAGKRFESLLASPATLIGWHSLFMLMTGFIVVRGVTSGIEAANKIMMPSLFLIVLVLLAYGIFAADMVGALKFMFHFNAKEISASVVLSAMGHAFFTLSLGMGAIMTYGSYLDRGTPIVRTCLHIALADTAIALLAGLAIFAIVFANGQAPAAGPGLILQTLPIAFAQMPMGHIIGILFFLLVLFAAWTSSISLLEPFVSYITERFNMSRTQATWVTCGAVWLLGIAVCLSFNSWENVKFFGLGIFDLLDAVTSKLIMPLSGLLIAIFAGWIMRREHVREELAIGDASFHLLNTLLRYVAPIAITLIFLNVIGWLG